MRAPALLLALSLAALAACDDPAKDKSKAITTGAVTETTSASGVPHPFDQATSKVQWTGAKVTAKHEGSFDTFKGTVNLVDNAPEKSSVTVDIDTASLRTTPEKLVGHLKSADFFDVTKFPKATFTSTKIDKGGDKGATHTVTGNLTLHGVTKSITFPATVKLDGDGVGVNAEFAINRKDFGLVYPGMPDDLIREDVVLRLAIRAKKP
jgi:polyisoprenoid-binding protein YceI